MAKKKKKSRTARLAALRSKLLTAGRHHQKLFLAVHKALKKEVHG